MPWRLVTFNNNVYFCNEMTTTIIISIVAAILMVAVGFILGTRGKSGQQGYNAVLLDNLRYQPLQMMRALLTCAVSGMRRA